MTLQSIGLFIRNSKMNSIMQIEKLDVDNYETWSLQMKSVLIHLDLLHAIEESLGHEANDEAKKVFKTANDKAVATIILAVQSSQLHHIKGIESARGVWNKLREVHLPNTPVRKITLCKKLLSLKMMESEKMNDFLDKFVDLTTKLNETGLVIQDELLTVILLSSLPESYENFIIAMETRDHMPSIHALKHKLLEESERRKEKELYEVQQHAYGATQAKYKGNVNNDNDNKIEKKKRKFKCFKCGKQGHFVANCKAKREQKNSFASNVLAATNESMFGRAVWCIDSGATSHMCCDRSLFDSFVETKERIVLAANEHTEAVGKGNVTIKLDRGRNLILQEVLYVPALNSNFISVGRCISNGLIVNFQNNEAMIKMQNGCVVMRAQRECNLFIFKDKRAALYHMMNNESILWHYRFGHINYQSLNTMFKNNLVKGVNLKQCVLEKECEACAKSKICSQQFSKETSRSKTVLDLIHSDICGPMKESIGGAKYFMTFIDDYSRRIFVYFLNKKSEALSKFKIFHLMVERQTGKKIKVLRSDNGKEYINREFDEYLQGCGIKRQLTVPYTPQQNGVAERANRTLVELGRAMMSQSNLAEHFWAEAISTAAYVRNRCITKILNNKTPMEIWSGKKPNVAHLRVFGCKAIVLDKTHHSKFKPKGKECIFLGYSLVSKAYRLYDIEARRIIVSRDVKFDEMSFHNRNNTDEGNEMCSIPFSITIGASSTRDEGQQEQASLSDGEAGDRGIVNDENVNVTDTVDQGELRRAPGRPRILRTGRRGRPKRVCRLYALRAEDVKIPETAAEAMDSEFHEDWKAAMMNEYQSLMNNQTWCLMDLPTGKKAIGCRWVFNVKKDKKGNVERFKARLVAKGCSQKYGVNYTETYSPVVRHSTIRMIFAIAASLKLHVHHLDVTTAYLNSDLTDEVYMSQPEYFQSDDSPEKVLRLKKAIYGLKQAGREWHKKIDHVLKEMGFKPCISEPCLYTKNKKGNYNLITVYVDDILIVSTKMEDLKAIKGQIAERFEVSDKGSVQLYLGLEVNREGDTGAISLGQQNYIDEMLREYGMTECRKVSTPLDPGFKIECCNQDCKRVDVTRYQSMIGSLMYLAVMTRPDILHAVCKMAQCNQDPHVEHETAVKHIFRYLCGTRDMKLHYNSSEGELKIQAFVDADWGNDVTDRKSYGGHAFMMAGGVFSYESKKQNTVALSSTEAEYIALTSVAKEAVYLSNLLSELELNIDCRTMIVNCDNLSAQNIAKNSMYHSRTKHIDIKYHFLKNLVQDDKIKIRYVESNENLADVFTKSLQKGKHEKFTKMLGIK